MSEQVETNPTDWVREQIEQIQRTGTTEGITVKGSPIILMTLRGAKTGKLRHTPVMRVEHDGDYAIVASKGGADEHPTWYHNIVAHPEFPIQDGRETKTYRARIVTGDERAQWWERAVAAFPSYADYAKSTDREIPVFVAEPV
ncbi:nitroreductase family deazaflavin-dependent oxidoreductase [Actinomycetospora soli]|uniref:nitroreductase family deazaflavin-dependent oxidoreductase n=1 Tax=Actinomycetospora soli TaxID=2893887 RepID=UPI001E5A75D3|nr:nitroreductase family deazaflavin-dependent oxidoreductase [Actinomycetospora soli]MCD2190117.1 nitroreductase family deazaflavin-dependent oxidoreductase [Actinomycetospora soli]